MMDVNVTKDLENKSLVVEFEVTAPKEKVWQAYTDKDMFEKWWGPEGWETTVKEFNLTPGGRVHYGMKCVDENQGDWFGQTSWGVMEIVSVSTPDSFTYKDYFSDEEGKVDTSLPVLTITNEYTEADGKTKVVSRSLADSAEQIEELIKMGMIEGFKSQLTKLDVLLAE